MRFQSVAEALPQSAEALQKRFQTVAEALLKRFQTALQNFASLLKRFRGSFYSLPISQRRFQTRKSDVKVTENFQIKKYQAVCPMFFLSSYLIMQRVYWKFASLLRRFRNASKATQKCRKSVFGEEALRKRFKSVAKALSPKKRFESASKVTQKRRESITKAISLKKRFKSAVKATRNFSEQ